MNTWETQLRKGVIELAVLAWIARGETYGYEVVERLRRLDGLVLTESTVYPVLTRLARDGCLAVRLVPSPTGPVRRYYRLTEPGRARLAGMTRAWQTLSGSIATLLCPSPPPGPTEEPA